MPTELFRELTGKFFVRFYRETQARDRIPRQDDRDRHFIIVIRPVDNARQPISAGFQADNRFGAAVCNPEFMVMGMDFALNVQCDSFFMNGDIHGLVRVFFKKSRQFRCLDGCWSLFAHVVSPLVTVCDDELKNVHTIIGFLREVKQKLLVLSCYSIIQGKY